MGTFWWVNSGADSDVMTSATPSECCQNNNWTLSMGTAKFCSLSLLFRLGLYRRQQRFAFFFYFFTYFHYKRSISSLNSAFRVLVIPSLSIGELPDKCCCKTLRVYLLIIACSSIFLLKYSGSHLWIVAVTYGKIRSRSYRQGYNFQRLRVYHNLISSL